MRIFFFISKNYICFNNNNDFKMADGRFNNFSSIALEPLPMLATVNIGGYHKYVLYPYGTI